ncbi:hypothetical protein QR77_30055 [Streptomyces sp. 150FB]|nr:hypothetical protein QR77_30055 [Streptomyces sp. 150FB]
MIFRKTTLVEVLHQPVQTPCCIREIVLRRSRDDQQLPGERHAYALRDLQTAHLGVRFFQLFGD